MSKREYISPEMEIKQYQLNDVIMTSVEWYKEHIAEPGDWGDDPIIDPDDEIDW